MRVPNSKPIEPDERPIEDRLMPAKEFVELGKRIDAEIKVASLMREAALTKALDLLDFASSVQRSEHLEIAKCGIADELAVIQETNVPSSGASDGLAPEEVTFEVQVQLRSGGTTGLNVAPASDYQALWLRYRAAVSAAEGGAR